MVDAAIHLVPGGMRLWSLHPKYLDSKGLVALWRETLLAQKVLQGKTKGYTNHPQLLRFKKQKSPLKFIGTYLRHIHREAKNRGYSFDETKILKQLPKSSRFRINVTKEQTQYEFRHLQNKLRHRSPASYMKIKAVRKIDLHPLFHLVPGSVELWEVASKVPGKF